MSDHPRTTTRDSRSVHLPTMMARVSTPISYDRPAAGSVVTREMMRGDWGVLLLYACRAFFCFTAPNETLIRSCVRYPQDPTPVNPPLTSLATWPLQVHWYCICLYYCCKSRLLCSARSPVPCGPRSIVSQRERERERDVFSW